MFTYINVSLRPHCAINHLTGEPSSRASPDACSPPPHPVWLPAGVPYLVAVCGGAQPHGDCGVPVLLAFQRVPDCAGLSRRTSWHTTRRRWSALHRCPVDHLDALAHALARRPPQKSPTSLWLVPHPVELCHARHDAPG